ncbi:glycosyltransferase [Synechococcus sp. MIT S9504]|uniref:glycosyltransferase n=1 Tax=Synechococcus sp. MIT S9504 TaxID=1801628 RepID=UPI0007BBFEC6|nr:glycosyltransferase [Synechococcus sp. MIT S9504]KZR85050.1 putative teichuronic acid biosynthesis glycosyltransferase TuaH [Synechococcus sp. MIT S9504]
MADFVVLSTADWDHPLWTNKQHVATALADLGHRVLYVDSLGVRGPRVDRSDSGRIFRRLRRGLRCPRQVRPGVWVVSPLVLPGQVRGLAGLLNRWSLNFSLFVADLVLDLRRPLLWTFNPQTRAYLRLSRFQAVIYLCVDRIQAQPGMPVEVLEAAERNLCAAANALFTTSPQLHAALGPLNAGSHRFGNVADANHFGQALAGDLSRPSDWPQSTGPVLIFIGAIDAYKLDLRMLELLMERTPQWTYLFIGPVGETDPSTDVSGWRRLANVHLLGTRDYSTLPAYLAHADVALLPLQLNDYTRHMYPMKFFEYLAAGCPVVATAIPALADQADVAMLCPPDAPAFEAAIHRALAQQGPALGQRLERSRLNTYFTRTRAMLDCLDHHGLMPDEPLAPQAPSYHAVRSQWSRSRLSAQLLLAGLTLLDRCGQQALSERVLKGWLNKNPTNITLLSDLASRRLAVADNVEGCRLIERIWQQDGVAEILHQLLFRRSARPGSRIDQLALFDVLASSTALPLHYSGYCRVVRTYRAIDAKDGEALRRGVAGLEMILAVLEGDPDTYRCLKPNRENRAKLLISAQLTRLRALMALKDTPALEQASCELLASARRYDPFAIDLTTATRMTRNIMRSLTIAAVMAWHAEDADRFDAVVVEMERLRQACHADRFDLIANETHEDHRGFAEAVVTMLQQCRWSPEQPQARPDLERLVDPVLLVYFPDLRRQRAEKARRFLQSLKPL